MQRLQVPLLNLTFTLLQAVPHLNPFSYKVREDSLRHPMDALSGTEDTKTEGACQFHYPTKTDGSQRDRHGHTGLQGGEKGIRGWHSG